jgi:hypothetical protein
MNNQGGTTGKTLVPLSYSNVNMAKGGAFFCYIGGILMADDKYPKTVFDHEAFDYVGVKMKEPSVKPKWLGFYERIGVIVWLYVVGFIWMDLIEIPFGRFGQLMTSTLGVVLCFAGMGIALRMSNSRPAVTYQERIRRRWWTIIISSIAMIMWESLTYWLFTI